MSVYRKFAQRIQKPGVGDDLAQLCTGSTQLYPEEATIINSYSINATPMTDVVDPPDIEEIILQQRAHEQEYCLPFVDFPSDDISVGLLARKSRTLLPVVPEHWADADPVVRECARRYSDGYTVYNRRYLSYSLSQNVNEKAAEVSSIQKSLGKQDYEIDVVEEICPLQRGDSKRCSIRLNDTPRSSWASSVFDLKNSQSDELLSNLLDQTPVDDIDKMNEAHRAANRHKQIFALYEKQQDEHDEVIETRLMPIPPSEHFGQRILVKCLQLKLELELEPVFAVMALYDAKERKKISENFYFDLTPEPIKKLLIDHIPYQDISTLSRSVIFSITFPSPDIFIVVKLEKVLQPGDISEPYMKDEKSINKEKVASMAKQYCDKLGAYRMPFAWTAIHLMPVINSLDKIETLPASDNSSASSGSLDRRSSGMSDSFSRKRDDSLTQSVQGEARSSKSSSLDKRSSWGDETLPNLESFRPVTLTVSSFFKQEAEKLSDDDLYKFLTDLKRSSNSAVKKLKCIPGVMKLDISPCPEEPRYCLSPELYKIEPYPDEKGRPTKEVVEFPARELFVPFTMYRNLLYVYPRNVNFANRQGSARNIAVKVQFMAGGDDKQALPVIFGKSSCPEFASEVYTAVTYHNKNPDFYEEFKIKLPAKLTSAHHILFTFYHISCQLQKKEANQQTETILGYSWLPMIRDSRLHVGEFCLPVAMDKPSPQHTMVVPDVQLPGIKWIDHKGLFTVTLEAVSSIHTQDKKLDDFLRLCHTIEEMKIPTHIGESRVESELKEYILDVPDASTGPLVRFLPLMLDELVKLLVRPPVILSTTVNIAPTTFEAIATIVKNICSRLPDKNDMHGRNNLLTQYIHFCATLPHPDNSHHGGYGPVRPVSVPDFGSYSHVSHASRPLSMRPNDSTRSFMYSGTSMLEPSQALQKLVHEELAYQWVISNGPTREKAMSQAWFFFELMVKSMAEHLASTGLINAPRKQRFLSQFPDDCTALVVMITKEIIDKYLTEPNFSKQLNSSLAFFIFDILSLMDRGYVFNLTKYYCKALSAKVATLADPTNLILLKLDFIRIVASHEHYLTLNLPFTTLIATPIDAMSAMPPGLMQQPYAVTAELTDDFRQQHFLVGIILCDLVTALRSSNQSVHQRAIDVVSNLLYCHDLDPRFVKPEMRAKIAQLYLPLLSTVCDALPQLWDPASKLLKADGDCIDRNIAHAISTSSVLTQRIGAGQVDVSQKDLALNTRGALNFECTRGLLICCLWVLKNMDRGSLYQLWSKIGATKLSKIVELLYLCLANFEYKAKWIPRIVMREAKRNLASIGRKLSFNEDILKQSSNGGEDQSKSATLGVDSGSKIQRSSSFHSMMSRDDTSTLAKKLKYVSQQTIKKSSDMKSKLEDVILGNSSARNDLLSRRKHSNSSLSNAPPNVPPSPQTETKLRWRKDQTQWRQEQIRDLSERARAFPEPDFLVLGNLSAEVSLIVLDMLEIIIKIIQEQDSLQNLLTSVIKVLLHSLSINQSTHVLQHTFSTQRSLVTKYPELLFEENTEACADLCLHLLRHCSSSIASTRSHAAASLYMLMRQNFELGNNFARVKMQVTMSLSHLVGHNQFYNEEFLRSSLKTILTYAEHDVELQDTTFPDQVKDLVFNLHMILSDTVKMKEFQEDPEMLLDLMYRIAKGYQNSPDLRLTWLQNMASKHTENENHAEAAECYTHCAGLVVEYMNMIEEKPYLPVGCVSFQRISQNVLEESAVSDDVVSPDEEGICTGKFFTDTGLISLLEQSANSFNKAGMFEMVNEIYKLLIPMHEASHAYEKLAYIHGSLQTAFKNIINNEGKRMFGTYFRVGFYGAKFGDLDGQEYVYKEPSITKLPEIAHRLESFYGDRFGAENVSIIKDSNAVERDKLEQGKAYMQLTYVEPYFDAYELKDRFTYFEKNYNIRRFMYATPFTRDGRAHGDLHEQYKRKTILTTAQAFPYVKTRITVIGKEQVILSPIEVAIEDIQKKTKELHLALVQAPTDTKMLQMVLQGCIGTTVNQGPLEVASVFLSDVVSGAIIPSKHHNKLRLCFKEFIRKCGDALDVNKNMIGADQQEYHKELVRNYNIVKDKLEPMISTKHNHRSSTTNGLSPNTKRLKPKTKETRKTSSPIKSIRST